MLDAAAARSLRRLRALRLLATGLLSADAMPQSPDPDSDSDCGGTEIAGTDVDADSVVVTGDVDTDAVAAKCMMRRRRDITSVVGGEPELVTGATGTGPGVAGDIASRACSDGARAARGVTASTHTCRDGELHEPRPYLLSAATRATYHAPSSRPAISIGLAVMAPLYVVHLDEMEPRGVHLAKDTR
jgi:hypothetical protein